MVIPIGISLMNKIVFELCAETLDACLAAKAGGAHRIELCTALNEDGLTPSSSLIHEAVQKSGLPVHVLLRPRGGDFNYTDAEMDAMRKDLNQARSLGVSGVVLGFLHPDRTVDIERTRELVEMAGPIEVTFNRAFDHTASLEKALEDVIATGCRRVLTSGGERDVVLGAESLARLLKQAGSRIDVAVGGGLRLSNAEAVARTTGARHFHGSVRRRVKILKDSKGADMPEGGDSSAETRFIVESSDVRQMIESLRNASTYTA